MEIIFFIALIQWLCAWFAIRFRTDKLTDIAYWGTFFLLVLGLYLWWSTQNMLHTILLILISCWSLRLALYLFLRVLALGKDKRFDGIREQKHAFIKFRLLQWIVIFLLLVPIIRAMWANDPSVTWYTLLWIVFAWGGIMLESIADRQKFRFKQQYPTRRCAIGVWSKIQYPNYLGEIMVWVGIYLICLSTLYWNQVVLWLISPFTVIWLLIFVTWIPPLEEAHQKKWWTEKEWKDYTTTTPKLIPWIY